MAASSRWPGAVTRLVVPDRPSSPYYQHRRKRPRPDGNGTPMLTRLLTRRATTPWDEPVQGGTTLGRPAQRAGLVEARREPASTHHVGNLGSGMRLPRALKALAHDAVVTEDGRHPLAELEPLPRGARLVVLAGRATLVPLATVKSGMQRSIMVTSGTAICLGAPF
jgi:hypothetical protein